MDGDVFDEIGSSKAAFGNPWINIGKYRFEVQKLLLNKDKDDVRQFIAELKVLKSEQTNPNVVPNAVGTTASYVVKFKVPAAKGNVKSFLMALLGMDEKEYDTAVGEGQTKGTVASRKLFTEQAGTFLLIDDEAYNKPTTKGEDFTRHKWAHVELSTEQLLDIAKRQQAARK